MTTDTNTASGAEDLASRLRNACTSVRSKSYPLADLIPLMQQAADALATTPAQPTEPAPDAVFEFWWADHMPNATQTDAWAEWCALRSNPPDASPAQPVAKESPHPEYDKGFSDGWNRCEARQAAPAQPVAEQGVAYAALPAWWTRFIQTVCEIPDRNSPEGEPDAIVATPEELAECALAAIESDGAPHGQAPAPTHEQIAAYLESTGAYVTNDATREAAIAEAIDTDRAKRGQAPDLHPKTSDLVQRFAAALAEKLSAAEKKYGYSDGWASPNWMDECRQHLNAHIAKGDPRDVAAYCAFLWHHGATTASPQAAQADSALEDAVRYRWLAEHCRSTSEHWGGRWSIVVEGPAPKSHDSEDDFDAAIDAGRKQGASNDR